MPKLTAAMERALAKLTDEWQDAYALYLLDFRKVRLQTLEALVNRGYAEQRFHREERGDYSKYYLHWVEYRRKQDA